MSNNNDNLMERAAEAMDEWQGTMWARVIERDLEVNDLEALKYHLAQAEAEQAIQESNEEYDAGD